MLKEITKAEFDQLVFDTTILNEQNSTPVFINEKPCIVDFYASWCGPCKMLAPILEKIANSRDDINIYKVNIEGEEEQPLAAMMGIRSIPTLIFAPGPNQQPSLLTGAPSEQELTRMIEEHLLKNDGIEDAKIIEE